MKEIFVFDLVGIIRFIASFYDYLTKNKFVSHYAEQFSNKPNIAIAGINVLYLKLQCWIIYHMGQVLSKEITKSDSPIY